MPARAPRPDPLTRLHQREADAAQPQAERGAGRPGVHGGGSGVRQPLALALRPAARPARPPRAAPRRLHVGSADSDSRAAAAAAAASTSGARGAGRPRCGERRGGGVRGGGRPLAAPTPDDPARGASPTRAATLSPVPEPERGSPCPTVLSPRLARSLSPRRAALTRPPPLPFPEGEGGQVPRRLSSGLPSHPPQS